ncbi:endo alpha-1,4 polygalactosaminidase [Streptomyces sp. NPDC059785]|uniref:endo alpha-1,4 polygalactosaminidase n=1 Tax=Streptomyces sp. NPDC059785 TaxID=3346945 RepID=UPI0036548C3D
MSGNHKFSRMPSRKVLAVTAAGACVAALAATLSVHATTASAAEISLPPTHAGFDYQIGGAYTPPSGVEVVTRDHTASPVDGLYNICYVNAFQAQPGAESEWGSNLLLHDGDGEVVYDDAWGEAMLDITTEAKRESIAAKVGTWIDDCAANGFQAVEPDNYDTFTRADGLIDAADAEAFIQLLADRAHSADLAIAQKNTAELAGDREANGLDFAVVEECGRYDECGDFTDAFGDDVIVVEYSASGLKKACSGWGDELSIVRRDEDVTTPGSGSYVRKTC